ncbi:nap family protein [Niveomyces insectorum RCEF 264]|uniref:Nap family protein n=1 Tax=Niveomyces insectorum RCEF 264 TaxID=1081102 RepID=A0A167YYI4_9HYPO|nr:nap family protein [Niveomyces insectorum RCEF 264]
MAATPQPSSVTYEELADLEAEFDDLDVELLRLQARRERPLYERRAQLVRRIPNFWPLVLEQAPPEIDQYIQPTDANLLLSALEDVEITRFEVLEADEASTIAADTATEAPAMAGSANGTTTVLPDPRSLAIRFTFAPNDYFADRVLEKRFWYRHAPSGGRNGGSGGDGGSWSGLVSEPVSVQWKPGKDLTGGVLDLAVQAFQAAGTDREADATAALQAALDKTSVDGLSFFAWFGYVGRRITAQESQTAAAEQRAKRAAREARRAEKRNQGASAAEGEEDENDADGEDEDEDDDGGYPHEIFLDGDTVAVTLAEDVWPNAIKYFRQAQEQDALSDDDFESGSEVDEPSGAPPSKKQKT